MAKPREAIGEKEFVSESLRWYRRIGEHRYRITVTRKTDKRGPIVEMTAERFTAWGKPWEKVHTITLPRKES